MNCYKLHVLLCILLTDVRATDPETCQGNVTDFNGAQLSPIKDCPPNKPCVIKCCGENEVFTSYSQRICTNINKLNLNGSNIILDYSNLKIYRSDIESHRIQTEYKFKEKFHLVQNKVFLENRNCSSIWPRNYSLYILENGDFAGYVPSLASPWRIKKALTFCVELAIGRKNNSTKYQSKYKYYYMTDHPNGTFKTKFFGVVMMVSVFFLLLVLVVYCVLPQLRNLSGMLFMVYVMTLCAGYLVKAYIALASDIDIDTCKVISPVMYFLFVSSFIWLSIMSFDIWWAFRGMRYQRQINRKGELVKFSWYCLFVWGITASMTITAILIDNADLTNWPNVVKPAFETCFYVDSANRLYLYTPIGIITLFNIVLFGMTVYNVWIIEHSLKSINNSSTNKKNQSRLRSYVKMSMLMGISWVLEVVQSFYEEDKLPTWVFIILNLYNGLIGVVIFFMFIFNKTILNMLCNRFNIKNKLIHDLSMDSSRTRSNMSQPSTNKGSYNKSRATEHSDIDMSEIPSIDTQDNDQMKSTPV